MTQIELNAEVLHNMSIIAEDEQLLKRAAKYMRKLVGTSKTSFDLRNHRNRGSR